MTTILIVEGILILLLLFSNSARYSSRYDNIERSYPPPHPYYPMPPRYEQHDYYRYRDEKTHESLVSTVVFVVLLICVLFFLKGKPTENSVPPQSTYSKPPPR